MLTGKISRHQALSKFGIYRIYPYKCPLPINRPPTSSQPLQSSYFGVLHPSQQPPAFRFRESEKRCVLVFPQSNITTKHGNFDHRHITRGECP